MTRICGSALLPKQAGEGYVDGCHLCYLLRRDLIDRFPEHLAPRQVYDLEER